MGRFVATLVFSSLVIVPRADAAFQAANNLQQRFERLAAVTTHFATDDIITNRWLERRWPTNLLDEQKALLEQLESVSGEQTGFVAFSIARTRRCGRWHWRHCSSVKIRAICRSWRTCWTIAPQRSHGSRISWVGRRWHACSKSSTPRCRHRWWKPGRYTSPCPALSGRISRRFLRAGELFCVNISWNAGKAQKRPAARPTSRAALSLLAEPGWSDIRANAGNHRRQRFAARGPRRAPAHTRPPCSLAGRAPQHGLGQPSDRSLETLRTAFVLASVPREGAAHRPRARAAAIAGHGGRRIAHVAQQTSRSRGLDERQRPVNYRSSALRLAACDYCCRCCGNV